MVLKNEHLLIKAYSDLAPLFVIPDRKSIQHHTKAKHRQEVVPDVIKAAALKHHHPHNLDKVGHWIDFGKPLRPYRHAIYRGVQSAQQYENHHHEKGQQHRLLLGVCQ